jgi:predicted nucleic acid-binding protein
MDVSELDAALGSTHRAFVDTSTCIAYHSTSEHAHPLARHLFGRIAEKDDPLVAYFSIITASEMLVRPIRAADSDLTAMHKFLRGFPNLYMVDADLEIAHQAANIRALSRLALPDSLIVGTAVLSACEVIITIDERWSRRLTPLYPQFRWIYLGR